MAKNNTSIWFRSKRGSYLPSSIIGLVIYFAYVAYIVAVLIEWYRLGYHVWTLLTVVLPVIVVAAIVVQFIASKHSK